MRPKLLDLYCGGGGAAMKDCGLCEYKYVCVLDGRRYMECRTIVIQITMEKAVGKEKDGIDRRG